MPYRLAHQHPKTPQLRGTGGEDGWADMTIQLQGRLPPLERPTYFPQWVLVESSRGRQPPLPAAARLLMASYPTFQRSLTELLPNSNQYAFFASLLTYPPSPFSPNCCVQRFGASQISRADPPLHPAAMCGGVAASRMGATGRVGGDLATSPSPPRGRRRGLAIAIPRAGTAPTACEGLPCPRNGDGRRRPHLTAVARSSYATSPASLLIRHIELRDLWKYVTSRATPLSV